MSFPPIVPESLPDLLRLPLAFFGNLNVWELVVIFGVALMVFGKNLPQVAMQAAVRLGRLKRQLSQMWQEAGLEQELRRVQREVESSMPRLESPVKTVQRAGRDYLRELEDATRVDVEATSNAASDKSASSSADSVEEAVDEAQADDGVDDGSAGWDGGLATGQPDPEPAPPVSASSTPDLTPRPLPGSEPPTDSSEPQSASSGDASEATDARAADDAAGELGDRREDRDSA